MMMSGWVRLDPSQSARRAASDRGNRVVSAMRPEYRFDPDPWPFPQSISQPLNHAANCAHPTYNVGHRTRAGGIFRSQPQNIEPGGADEIIHLPVQMATSRYMAPNGGESVLSALDSMHG